MGRRWWWGALLGLSVVGLAFVLGFHQDSQQRFTNPVAVWTIPFDNDRQGVHKSPGLDGRIYGPLGFLVEPPHLWVLDSYGHRVVEYDTKGSVLHEYAYTGWMGEAIARSPRSQQLFVADNQSGTVWQLQPSPKKLVVSAPSTKGITQSVGQLQMDGEGRLWVELIRVGRGQLQSIFRVYRPDGQVVRQMAATLPVADAGEKGISLDHFVRHFALSPQGELCIEVSPSPGRRAIEWYSADGTFKGRFAIQSSLPMKDTELLGVNQQDWVYVGVNLDSGAPGEILVYNATGSLKSHWVVPSEPVRSMQYGQVMPDGSLYLVQNLPSSYRLVRYRLKTTKLWRWY